MSGNPIDRFDVAVVGAGSAGCAAAARLVEQTGLEICLLEAGPDYGPLEEQRWPPELLDAGGMPTTHDWEYMETRGDEQRPERRAKVVGGCSAHNQCAAVWPQPDEFDAWGAAEWSRAQLEPFIREVDTLLGTRPYPDDQLSFWQRSFLAGALHAGFPRIDDVGATEATEGVAPFHANVRDGVRWNAAFAFLDRARQRPNLTVRAQTHVERLVEEPDCVALLCRSGGRELELRARRCLLCAGADGSPSILLGSRMGPPGVGKNLHDHCGLRVRFRPSENAIAGLEDDLANGRFHQSQVILRARSRHAEGAFDLHLAPYQTLSDEGEWTFQILAFYLAPRSRGRLTLGPDDGRLATIDFGFLTDPEAHDEAALADALRLVRALARTEPLAAAVAGELEPRADGPIVAQVRSTLTGYAHAVGTCSLGAESDPDVVIDPHCRVRGTRNVYVADASIMPTIPRANTNLTCFLVGLRAADLIAEESLR